MTQDANITNPVKAPIVDIEDMTVYTTVGGMKFPAVLLVTVDGSGNLRGRLADGTLLTLLPSDIIPASKSLITGLTNPPRFQASDGTQIPILLALGMNASKALIPLDDNIGAVGGGGGGAPTNSPLRYLATDPVSPAVGDSWFVQPQPGTIGTTFGSAPNQIIINATSLNATDLAKFNTGTPFVFAMTFAVSGASIVITPASPGNGLLVTVPSGTTVSTAVTAINAWSNANLSTPQNIITATGSDTSIPVSSLSFSLAILAGVYYYLSLNTPAGILRVPMSADFVIS